MNQELITMIKAMKGGNPQQIAMDLLKKQPVNNPTVLQLINYARMGDNTSLLNLATNYFQQIGVDMNTEFNELMSLLK